MVFHFVRVPAGNNLAGRCAYKRVNMDNDVVRYEQTNRVPRISAERTVLTRIYSRFLQK